MGNAIRIDRCPHCSGVLRERTKEQNDLLHAVITDISRQKEWAGKWLSVEEWKRLLIAGWERTRGNGPSMYPAVDGKGFDFIYTRSSRLAKQDMTELVEYVSAWAIDQGVHLHDREAA